MTRSALRCLPPCLALIAFLAAAAPARAVGVDQALGWELGRQSGQGAYLVLSDIHFDPFVDPSLAKELDRTPADGWDAVFAKSAMTGFPSRTDDTNWPLFQSALSALALPGAPYDYVLILGDCLAHDFVKKYKDTVGGDTKGYEAFVNKTLSYVNRSLAKALPGVPLYFALGNNDTDCGDYAERPGGSMLSFLAKDWAIVAADTARAKGFAQTGAYEAALPGHAGTLIVLNDVFWSRRYSDVCGDAAKEEMDWLRARLEADADAGHPVTLAMHIPPGMNAYGSQCGLPAESYLKPEIQAPFLELLERHAAGIRLAFASHTHFDDLKILSVKGKPVLGVHLAPSIGPNHGNNPSFQVGLYRRDDGSLLDLATYTLSNLTDAAPVHAKGDWEFEYGFRDAYKQDFTTLGLAAASREIHDDAKARALYESYFACRAVPKSAPSGDHWLPYSCAQTCFTPADFAACACSASAR